MSDTTDVRADEEPTLLELRTRWERAADLLNASAGEVERARYAYLLAVRDGQAGNAAEVRLRSQLFCAVLADLAGFEAALTERLLRAHPATDNAAEVPFNE